MLHQETQIIDAILNYDIEETIQKESVIITITLQGYIKRGALSNVKQQKGAERENLVLKQGKRTLLFKLFLLILTHRCCFSHPKVVWFIDLKLGKYPEGTATSKGKSVSNLLQWKNHQSISSIMPFPDEVSEKKDHHIIFRYEQRKIKKK